MLSRNNADDLLSRVATLSDVLTVKVASDEVDAARRAFTAAIEAVKIARDEHAVAARENFGNASLLKSAADKIDRCAAKWEARRAELSAAEARINTRFLASANYQIDAALPVLEDLMHAVSEMLSAFEALQLLALRKNLPAPRLLNAIPLMRKATNHLTAELNRRR